MEARTGQEARKSDESTENVWTSFNLLSFTRWRKEDSPCRTSPFAATAETWVCVVFGRILLLSFDSLYS